MKKFVAMLLALVMVFALCACGDKPQDDKQVKAAVKVGFICLHDENSTYDKNFIDAAKAALQERRPERGSVHHQDQYPRGSGVLQRRG